MNMANLLAWILETFIKVGLELFDCTISKVISSFKNRKTNFLGNLSIYYSYLSKTKVKYFIDKGNEADLVCPEFSKDFERVPHGMSLVKKKTEI